MGTQTGIYLGINQKKRPGKRTKPNRGCRLPEIIQCLSSDCFKRVFASAAALASRCFRDKRPVSSRLKFDRPTNCKHPRATLQRLNTGHIPKIREPGFCRVEAVRPAGPLFGALCSDGERTSRIPRSGMSSRSAAHDRQYLSVTALLQPPSVRMADKRTTVIGISAAHQTHH